MQGASDNRSPAAGADAGPLDVAIVGGGVAGVEALLALHDLAGERVRLTLISAGPDFVYRPQLVDEPFSGRPAERRDLRAVVEGLGGRFVLAPLASVDPTARRLKLVDGPDISYDAAILAIGAKVKAPFTSAITLAGPGERFDADELVRRAARHPSARIAFVIPPGVTWSLPAYEAAMLTARRARELREELEIVVVTPEASPLGIFGSLASDRVHDLLRARGVSVLPSAYAREDEPGVITIAPGGAPLDAAAVIALPLLVGARIEGVPADAAGFIPIDQHARVAGCDGLYAAGDGTNFPIKQGGIGTQQADAAAEHIAHRVGAVSEPEPFVPVLRGKLITGDEHLHLRADLSGGAGDGFASEDYLWWPPHKISGRYLSAWIAGETPRRDPEPPRRPIDVEVALPREWHREPMDVDPYAPGSVG